MAAVVKSRTDSRVEHLSVATQLLAGATQTILYQKTVWRHSDMLPEQTTEMKCAHVGVCGDVSDRDRLVVVAGYKFERATHEIFTYRRRFGRQMCVDQMGIEIVPFSVELWRVLLYGVCQLRKKLPALVGVYDIFEDVIARHPLDCDCDIVVWAGAHHRVRLVWGYYKNFALCHHYFFVGQDNASFSATYEAYTQRIVNVHWEIAFDKISDCEIESQPRRLVVHRPERDFAVIHFY